MNTGYYETSLGCLEIRSDDGYIVYVGFTNYAGASSPDALTDMAAAQIREYLSGSRKEFDIPVRFSGTPFRIKIWSELQKIPYGKLRTYKQLAEAAGNERACRAAGSACGANPVCIIVPCHRVVGSDGSLTGFAYGTDIKRRLLELEGSL